MTVLEDELDLEEHTVELAEPVPLRDTVGVLEPLALTVMLAVTLTLPLELCVREFVPLELGVELLQAE